MSFGSLLIHPITIYLRTDGSDDDFGDPVDTFDSGTEVMGWVEPQSSSEDILDRDTSVTGYRMFLPDSAVIAVDSEVEWESLRMRVVGKPLEFRNRHGVHHTEIQTQLVEV